MCATVCFMRPHETATGCDNSSVAFSRIFARIEKCGLLETLMNLKRSIVLAGLAAVAVAAALPAPSPAGSLWSTPVLRAESLNCNLSGYKAAQGLTAAVEQDTLVVSWTGQNGADLR